MFVQVGVRVEAQGVAQPHVVVGVVLQVQRVYCNLLRTDGTMKLSKKIEYHAEMAESQTVDGVHVGVYVSKSRLYEWAERARGYETKLTEYEAVNQKIREIAEDTLEKTRAVIDKIKERFK